MTISPAAAADAGWLGADVEFQEVKALATAPDGRLYVADGMAAQVVILGPDGALVRRVGRSGDGPGEYRYPVALYGLTGGEVAVFDEQQWRLTTLGAGGELVATRNIPPMANFGQSAFIAFAPDGETFALTWDAYQVSAEQALGAKRKGIAQGMVGLAVLDTAAEAWTDLVPLPGQEVFIDRDAGQLQDPWYAAKPHLVVADRYVWSADGRAGTLYRLDRDGQRLCTGTLALTPVPIAPAERDSFYLAADVAFRGEAMVQRMRERRRDLPLPDSKAPIVGLASGEGGHVWVRLATRAGEPGQWLEVSPDLEVARAVSLPANFRIMAQRGSELYGVVVDRDGVAVLERYGVR